MDCAVIQKGNEVMNIIRQGTMKAVITRVDVVLSYTLRVILSAPYFSQEEKR